MSGWLRKRPGEPLPPPMPELQLPAAALAKASLRGNEHAWRLAEVPEAVAAAPGMRAGDRRCSGAVPHLRRHLRVVLAVRGRRAATAG